MMDMEQLKQQMGQMNMDQAMTTNGMGLPMLGMGHPQGRARQGQPPNVSALSCVVGTCALLHFDADLESETWQMMGNIGNMGGQMPGGPPGGHAAGPAGSHMVHSGMTNGDAPPTPHSEPPSAPDASASKGKQEPLPQQTAPVS